MTDITNELSPMFRRKLAGKMLEASAKFWFAAMLIGQWTFVYYILAYYGVLTIRGGIPDFGETHLPGGYVAGDTIGNLAIVSHVFLAVLVHGGGPLQLVPQLRNRFPTFHKWNGRVFLTTGVIVSIAGLYMTWLRGGGSTIGDNTLHVGTSISGVLVIIFAIIALRAALARDFKAHRRWALRLFMVVSTVWFSRVMLWGWVMVAGDAGIDWNTFTGPTLTVVYFGAWVLPLIILELYLRAGDSRDARQKFAMATGLFAVTLMMIVGIVGAAMVLWLPRM